MATIGYIEDTDFYSLAKKFLENDETNDLTTLEKTIADSCLTASYNLIFEKLSIAGLAEEDILDWVRGSEFQSDIGLYYFLVRLGRDRDGKDKQSAFISALDRRKELAEIEYIVFSDGSTYATTVDKTFKMFNLQDINDDLNPDYYQEYYYGES